jgi:hypothetical protein
MKPTKKKGNLGVKAGKRVRTDWWSRLLVAVAMEAGWLAGWLAGWRLAG